MLNIEKEQGRSPGTSDLDVFAFPVYAMDMPDIMLNHIRRLPGANGRKAAVIAVHGKLYDKSKWPGDGGDPGYSHGHAYLMLKIKGYDVFFTASVGYPHSISMLMSTPPPAEQTLIRASSDRRVEEFAESIASGKRSLQKCGLLAILYSAIPGALFQVFGRRGLGKLYVADSSCTKCGKCVNACPVKAVRISLGRPRWNWKCQGCQRCINVCPGKSIQLSLFRAVVMFGTIFLPLNAWAFMLLPLSVFSPHAGATGVVFDIAVWLILYLATLYILDKAFFLLEAAPILGKIMGLNLSSPNRRYLDPAFRAAINENKLEEQAAATQGRSA
jgi:ferredoxin